MKKFVKRTLSVLLAGIILMSSVPLIDNDVINGWLDLFFKASAEESSLAATGQCGENIFWTFDENSGLLTLSGTGAMNQYSPFESNTQIKAVLIGNGITSIGSNFYCCKNMENLTIPNTVVSIGFKAFEGCTGLLNVNYLGTIEEWINIDFETVGSNPLSGNNSIITFNSKIVTDFDFPLSMKTIKPYSLIGIRTLEELTIPDGISEIPESGIRECSNLKKITIPNSVVKLGTGAFYYCTGIEEVNYLGTINEWYNIEFSNSFSVTPLYYGGKIYFNGKTVTEFTLPENETTVPMWKFYNFSDLKKIVLPTSIESISEMAFYGCTSLEEIKIPDTVSSIGDRAFYNCKSLKTINIPCDLNNQSIFYGCKSLEDVNFSSNIITIGSGTFQECDSLSKIEIPYGVTSIKSKAFYGCGNLTEIIVPDSVLTIGSTVVYYNDIRHIDIYYTGSSEQWENINGHDDMEIGITKIHYNYGKETGTLTDTINWSFNTLSGKLLIEGSGAMPDFDDINDSGWYFYKDNIKFIEISDGITCVGKNSFNGCSALSEVYLGKNIVNIGENAFADCGALSIVTVMSNALSAENAFINNNQNLIFVTAKNNTAAQTFAQNKGYNIIVVEYSTDDKTINFGGNTIVYNELQYNYLTVIMNDYSSAEYMHFEKLEFFGVAPDVILIEDCENIDIEAQNFTLTDLVVCLNVVRGEHEERIAFGRMFELLENGDYDAFKLKMKAKEEIAEEDFFQKVVKFFEDFSTSALRAMSKAINFIVKIFRKK